LVRSRSPEYRPDRNGRWQQKAFTVMAPHHPSRFSLPQCHFDRNVMWSPDSAKQAFRDKGELSKKTLIGSYLDHGQATPVIAFDGISDQR
jgi:hypothetical protein